MIEQLLFFLHLFISISLVTLILFQQGRNSDISANFGGGGSQTLFGSRGSASFIAKVTGVLMGLFFLTSLLLGYTMSHKQTLKFRLSASNSTSQPHKHAPPPHA